MSFFFRAENVYLSWPCCRNGQVRQRGCLHLEMAAGGFCCVAWSHGASNKLIT